ncbi:hypothetical protein [Microvirga massiliensis]|nr:hypothetical protein [Microvirga massiliensis]
MRAKEWQPMEMAVCIGFDALRIATGRKPKHFTVAEVLRWLTLAAERV